MAKVEQIANTLTQPRWCGQALDRHSLLPGGLKINPDDAGIDDTAVLPSGTFVGRTIAERDAGTGFGAIDAADEEFGLVAFDVDLPRGETDIELVRVGTLVYENHLAWFSGAAAPIQTLLRDNFITQNGPA